MSARLEGKGLPAGADFRELLSGAVEKTASAEDGIVTNDVVFPMVKTDEGTWDISEDIDDSVLDAVMGGFMTAINNLTQQLGTE